MDKYRSVHRFTLAAEERLKLRKDIETLFQQGEAFSVFPLRVVYRLSALCRSESAPLRAGFSIPKKRIRRAVGRNRIRRLLKEAWRYQKAGLFPFIPDQKQLHCFFIYTGHASAKEFTLAAATEAISLTVKKLQHRLKDENTAG